MEYSHDDTELVDQPIGYWSWAAHQAVVDHIRGELAKFRLTQPQWWVLNRLALSTDGRSHDELRDVLQGYLDIGESVISSETAALFDRGLIETNNSGLLQLTAKGKDLHAAYSEHYKTVRRRIHSGIADPDYVRTLKVLQRMIYNVGGTAWHH